MAVGVCAVWGNCVVPPELAGGLADVPFGFVGRLVAMRCASSGELFGSVARPSSVMKTN